MIVTIDGPAGAGKSSAARSLAERLGFWFLSTGATFRAVTLAVLRHNVDAHDEDALADLLFATQIDLDDDRVLLNGEDVTAAIHTSQVSAMASTVATSRVVRQHLAELQRRLAEGRNVVCEGRDQGTVVFPDAACKFFLTANPLERARRRRLQLAEQGEHVDFDKLVSQQRERDQRDSERELAPLKPASDAVHVDSTFLTEEQVVERMENVARQCQLEASRR